MLRPALEAVSEHLPEGVHLEVPRLALGWRLLIALPVMNLAMGTVLAGIFAKGNATLGDFMLGILGATIVTLTVSVWLIAFISDSVATSMRDLREGARRIGGGELAARVPVASTDETGELAQSFNEMAAGLAERERIREAFGTYVDRDVAEHILREGTSLEGEEVEVTMLFLDIRGFTTFAERLSAAEVVATLNRLFERIVPIIHEHGGHVDKYVGDGLLAVFGAPRRQADHADQALAAGLEIAAAVSDEFGDELSVGVGLNSGPVVAGNVGGAGRLEFSVIGDAVNVAARVESATRQTGDAVLIAGRTRELLTGARMDFVERAGSTLKGKTQPVAIYAPVVISSPVRQPAS
jgi:adenylate cyclase